MSGIVKIYLCKYCGFYKEADDNNFCPQCAHYMCEQEWSIDTSYLDDEDEDDYDDEDEDD